MINDFLNSLPTPAYSLYDLYKDLLRGSANTFVYNGQTFQFEAANINCHSHVITAPNGLKFSTKDYIPNMTEIQGMAALLAYYNQNLTQVKGQLFNSDTKQPI